MSRIQQTFQRLARQGKTGLVPYITAGDPARENVVRLMQSLVKNGADVIELGVPFSDPMADGPVIQRSSERALARHVTLQDCLAWVREFRSMDAATPVVLMGYANPVERFGLRAFVAAAKEAGVDGTIIVDYPPEECEDFSAALKSVSLDPIFLLAPTSTESRMRDVARLGSGYLYYVSLRGVTGAAHIDPAAVAARVQEIRRFTAMPIGVGFGISDAASAVAVASAADAVVIGSALIRIMEDAQQAGRDPLQAAGEFMSGIRAALDAMPAKLKSEAA
ncbi:MAG: tryptophan synthase subunit alpha [Burkholderiaceae bacterium]|nr:tryptophan synthase subunit alpha [Burkholderiaceae bacterium]